MGPRVEDKCCPVDTERLILGLPSLRQHPVRDVIANNICMVINILQSDFISIFSFYPDNIFGKGDIIILILQEEK